MSRQAPPKHTIATAARNHASEMGNPDKTGKAGKESSGKTGEDPFVLPPPVPVEFVWPLVELTPKLMPRNLVIEKLPP